MSRFAASVRAHRRGLLAAAVLLVTLGIGVVVGRVTEHHHTIAAEDAGVIEVSAADNAQGTVRASTRRLRLKVDLGGGCVGDDATFGRIVWAGARETPGLVRLRVSVRRGYAPSGFCAGVGTGGTTEVSLPRPIGRRRIVNLSGTARVQRVSPARPFDNRPLYRLRGKPVITLRSSRAGRSLLVVLRVNRDLASGTRLQLDDSSALATLHPTDRRRRCYAAEVRADGDAERAPQLVDPRPGHHPIVSLIQPDGRYLDSRPGLVSTERKAVAVTRGSPLLGGLGCVAGD